MICPNCKAEYREGFFTCSDCKVALVEAIVAVPPLEETKLPELVTIAVFRSPYEAGLAKAELEAYGIQAFVADEFTVGANPLYSNALSGVKLKVAVARVDEAKEILSSEAAHDVVDDGTVEPFKGSSLYRVGNAIKALTLAWRFCLLES